MPDLRVTDGAGLTTLLPEPLTIERATIIDPPPPPDDFVDPVGIAANGRYDVIVNGNPTGELGPENQRLWDARYFHLLSSGAGWRNEGDRSAYRAAYDRLRHNGVDVMRFLFSGGYASGGGAATQITDQSMREGVGFYDGTLAPAGSGEELQDSPRNDWPGPLNAPPDQRWDIRAIQRSTGLVVELRSYRAPLNLGPNVTFALARHVIEPFETQGLVSAPHLVLEEVVIAAFVEGKRAAAVYYHRLSDLYSFDVRLVDAA